MENNPYKKGSKEFKAYNKGFKAGYSYYLDIELERLKAELETIKLTQKLSDVVYKLVNYETNII